MSKVALERLHTINTKRDDWHLSRERHVVERFDRKLETNRVNARLFTTATRTINELLSGRVRVSGTIVDNQNPYK